MTQPLHLQSLPAAAPSTKIRLAILGKALCDALGGPAEFQPRFSLSFVARMQPNENFGLPAGVWTDDTSMALALARSIATFSSDASEQSALRGGMDAEDQLDAYLRWWQYGELSATGHCFDIGNTILRALSLYRDALRAGGVIDGGSKGKGAGKILQRVGAALATSAAKTEEKEKRREAAAAALKRIERDLSGAVFGGNGSLMRVLPVGLAYWHSDADVVGDYARQSSATTHPNAVCREACAVWSQCVARVVRSAAAGARNATHAEMTKLDVLHHFASFPYTTPALQKALAAEVPLPTSSAGDPAAMEAHYAEHHRLLRLVAETLRTSSEPSAARDPPKYPATAEADADSAAEARTLARLPPAAALPSSGYVVHTLAAALYAFLATPTFEAGALLTANMGDDADTVAAVYGGLAGAWYAVEEKDEKGGNDRKDGGALFWSPRVRAWRDALVRRDVVEGVAEELVAFAEIQNQSS
ncbi:ADP-ribosylation/Crystallin J1 [Mycena galopus ATCC 62051]|nr:ADP-ribosylation/Crystallin J1 [Mycena galopus ATCC 62051]